MLSFSPPSLSPPSLSPLAPDFPLLIFFFFVFFFRQPPLSFTSATHRRLSILLSQAQVPACSSLALTVHSRLQAVFDAAGFPPSSEFFALLDFNLSQTLSSSFLALPFALSFLILAKSSVIRSLAGTRPSVPSSLSSFLSIYRPLLATYVCNSLVIISTNSTAFFLLFFAFNCLDGAQPGSSNYTLLISAVGRQRLRPTVGGSDRRRRRTAADVGGEGRRRTSAAADGGGDGRWRTSAATKDNIYY